jgi:hypothetical protein
MVTFYITLAVIVKAVDDDGPTPTYRFFDNFDEILKNNLFVWAGFL